MKYYVYSYTDPRTNEVFYIGKGSGDRCYRHLKETTENTDNVRKHKRICQIVSDGLRPVITIIKDGLCENSAYEMEERLIRHYGRLGLDDDGVLLNICVNNRPPDNTGRRHSEETRKKLRDAKRGNKNPMFGKETSEETKAKLREKLGGENNPFFRKQHPAATRKIMGEKSRSFHTGRKHSEATKEKISTALKGKNVPDETRQAIARSLTGRKQTHHTVEKRRDKQIGRPRPSRKYEWEVIDPRGSRNFTRSLAAFAAEIGLNCQSLRNVENSEKSYRGWRVVKHVRLKDGS